MYKYTKAEEKTMQEYNILKDATIKLEEFLQTEEFSKLSAEDRTDKIMAIHYNKQAMMELLTEIEGFVPEVVEEKPTIVIKPSINDTDQD